MEEVDEIVLHTLRQIGCDLGEINSLREFNTEIAIESVVRCLKLINPSVELSPHVPPSMSARYRMGSTLASLCTELGYKGEIGYQTFLYSNESDLRKIYLFLFENLPKESEKSLDEPLNKTSLVVKEAGLSLTESLNEPWLPNYCKAGMTCNNNFFLKNAASPSVKFKTTPLFNPFNYTNIVNKTVFQHYTRNHLQLVVNQVRPKASLAPSILEANCLDYVKQCAELDQDDLASVLNKKEIICQRKENIKKTISELLLLSLQQQKEFSKTLKDYLFKQKDSLETGGSRFTHSLELQFTPDKKSNTPLVHIPTSTSNASEEDMRVKRETEIKVLQDSVDALCAKVEAQLLERRTYEASSESSLDRIKKEQIKVDQLKEQCRVKKCTLSLLPQAETNIRKLQELIDASSQKLVTLANQWEQHRVPLIEQYRELKELSSRRVSETQRKLEEIKSMREKIRKLGTETRQKEETHKHLVTAYEKLTKDVSRSSYTRRIMEIVANIKKQKAEIDKVLLDTRNVQKEINKLSGKLERTFTVTDELIFKDAKRDEAIRRAYKYLASLHENCSALVLIVEDTGTIIREIRELEDQIEQENQKKIADTLERITLDYKQMQRENATLLAQFK